MPRFARLLECLAAALCLCPPLAGQGTDADFKPELAGVELTSREVRPGDPFALTLKFRNAGTKPARDGLLALRTLRDGQGLPDHRDQRRSSPGRAHLAMAARADDRGRAAGARRPRWTGRTGVFPACGRLRPERPAGRLLDSYAGGKLRVSRQAPSGEQLGPPRLSPAEIAQATRRPWRRGSRRILGLPWTPPAWRLDLDRTSGAWALTDKATGVLWTSDPARPRFGEVLLRNGKRSAIWRIDRLRRGERLAQRRSS